MAFIASMKYGWNSLPTSIQTCVAVGVASAVMLWGLGGRLVGWLGPYSHAKSNNSSSPEAVRLLTSNENARRSSTTTTNNNNNSSNVLHVISHNVWCHYIVPAPARLKRLKALATFISQNTSQCDVVMLQELFVLRAGVWVWSRELELFARKMADAGFIYSSNPFKSMPSKTGVLRTHVQNSGLVTFSRYPIIRCETVAFQSTQEATNTKGFVAATIKVPLADGNCALVHAINTHLDSRQARYKRAQFNQIAAYVSQLRATCGDACGVVLTGDWNVASREPLYDELNQALQKACPGIIDAFHHPEIGTMRTLFYWKPLLYLSQLYGGHAHFNDDVALIRNEIVIDHTFVGTLTTQTTPSSHTTRGSGGSQTIVGVQASVHKGKVLDIRDDANQPVSDHRGLHTVVVLQRC